MKKRITKKCVEALLTSILLTTCATAIVEAQTINTVKNQDTVWNEASFSEISEEQTRNASHPMNDTKQLNETILHKVKELTEQEIHLELIQTEIQNMLKNINTDFKKRGQNSMSLRGFYGIDIFSCRGFA
jgi:FKBP-type peptidyl-prolyl cis-trans isomerase (trigger factor)